MNKKVVLIISGIVIILVLILLFSKFSMHKEGGGCRFELIESTEYIIEGTDNVVKVLLDNGWTLTTDFDENEISEINTTNNDYPLSDFIIDKTIRYWQISAFKNVGEDTKRVDLIDEKGRLYEFINCV